MRERYGPNDLMPCGTDTARRRHLARGEDCPVCGTRESLPAPPDEEEVSQR